MQELIEWLSDWRVIAMAAAVPLLACEVAREIFGQLAEEWEDWK
jgi:hypothetical protein